MLEVNQEEMKVPSSGNNGSSPGGSAPFGRFPPAPVPPKPAADPLLPAKELVVCQVVTGAVPPIGTSWRVTGS
jgi:hypothetical protein